MEASPDELRALRRLAKANNWAAMPGRSSYQPVTESHASRVTSAELDEAVQAPVADAPSLQLSQYWGAYLQQLQQLSQHPDQAPSATSTDSTAMLASLLANNPALLQAMSSPQAGAPAPPGTVARLSPSAAAGGAHGGSKKAADGGSSDDTTIAGDPASFLLLGALGAANHPLRPVPVAPGQRPGAASGPSVSATAPGPDLIGSVFANAALAASRAMPQQFSADPAGTALGSARTGSDGLAGFKRSFTGDVKGQHSSDGAALPPKKRGEMAATLLGDPSGAGDAERGSQRSLSCLRSLEENSALGDGGQGGSPEGGDDALAAGSKCSKEKNREAQRRFRERQKSLIGDLRDTVDALTRESQAQSKRIFGLQEENRLLKMLLSNARSTALNDGGAGGGHS